DQGLLPETTREAIIVPLLKPGKDPTGMGAYRPLSMLNLDYKILSKALATRLLPLMPSFIHPDQAGFIPGRNTAGNIRRLFSVMNGITSSTESPGILAVDIEKAF
ncbi:hypothetical protein NDU88_001266, partial [Pleurodeles waltl]